MSASILSGSPAGVKAPAGVVPVASGSVVFTVAGAETSVQVFDARITPSAIVVLTGLGGVQACNLFSVDALAAGTFYVQADAAAAVVNKTVRYDILRF